MTAHGSMYTSAGTVAELTQALAERRWDELNDLVQSLNDVQLVPVLERLPQAERAVVYRLLPKTRALEVFEDLDPALQGELVHGLHDAEVTSLFAELDPDDRVRLLDELPASVTKRLLRELPEDERALTAIVLGYPLNSIGRRMSPEVITTRQNLSVGETLQRVRERAHDAETIYTVPVVDDARRVVGVAGLRDLMGADDSTPVEALMRDPVLASATEDDEVAARRLADAGLIAIPIVDNEDRLVGILTVDDAMRILEEEETEDALRQGAVEPTRRPYMATPILSIVRARVVWLLVLAVGATLTVQVLASFEATLEQMAVLALFIPLLIGTGGNTGNQAATTVTRALALGDVRPRDVLRVLGREVRVGALLGLLLGALGFGITAIVFDPMIGVVIGLTLLGICTVAATFGGVMPILARSIRVDPAVFSNPFISTFVDAIGLLIYFAIAITILPIG